MSRYLTLDALTHTESLSNHEREDGAPVGALGLKQLDTTHTERKQLTLVERLCSLHACVKAS